MMTEDKIRELVLQQIATGTKHSTHKTTVDIASHWRKIVSGEGQEEILLKFRDQDSKAQREQRVKLFNTHTPYLANRLMTPFREVDRCESIRQVLDVKDDLEEKINDKMYDAFTKETGNFYQGKSVDDYLDEMALEVACTDPNAYLLVTFLPFAEGEAPKTYPMMYSSREVFQKHYDHKELQHICFQVKMAPPAKPSDDYTGNPMYRYSLWTADYSYEIYDAEAVREFKIDVVGENYMRTIVKVDNNKTVELYWKQYQHLSGRVPAMRMGYLKTIVNDYTACESPFLPAKQLFNEHIQKKSTADNHITLYGYLRAFFYEQKCDHREEGQPCVNGKIGANQCPACEGRGTKGKHTIHRSEQDIITFNLPLPANATDEDIVDLSKMAHFVPIPKEVMEFNRQEVDSLSQNIALAIFNTNVFNRSELVAGLTATEIRYRLSSVYNVIGSYAKHKAALWKFIVEQIAHYHGIKGMLEINREYPSDYKMESVTELMQLLKEAKDTGSMETVRKVEMDIVMKQYVDQPNVIQMHKAKVRFKPFYTKSETAALASVSLLPANNPKRILWLYFDDIFHDIEYAQEMPLEGEAKQKRFYNLTYDEQSQVVAHYVAQYAALANGAEVVEVPFDDE